METVLLPDSTLKRGRKWGISLGARLVTHKELATAEELMQKALATPLEVVEEKTEEEAREDRKSNLNENNLATLLCFFFLCNQ